MRSPLMTLMTIVVGSSLVALKDFTRPAYFEGYIVVHDPCFVPEEQSVLHLKSLMQSAVEA